MKKDFSRKPKRHGPSSGAKTPRPAAQTRDEAQKPAQLSEGNRGPERIAKVMARAGLCSRRDAEVWIAEGRVSVNGKVISSPALNIGPADRVVVDGAPLPTRERTRLFLYHKDRGLVTTHRDPEGRPTIFDALPKDLPRLITVGRLDFNTEGLLLLTNDGGLARVLELPATGWLRRYRVRAHGSITQPELDALRKGVTVDGVNYGAIEATLDRLQGANSWITFAIREGKNREVRNVLQHLGLQVNRLIRISFGPFQLGELKLGEVEEVRSRVLRDQLGDRIIADAEADFVAPIVQRQAPPEPEPEFEERRPPRRDAREEPRKEPRSEKPRRDDNRRDEKRRDDKPRRDDKRRDDTRRDKPRRGEKILDKPRYDDKPRRNDWQRDKPRKNERLAKADKAPRKKARRAADR